MNAGPPGANFGWPVHEGMTNPPNSSYTNPLYTYDHDLGSAAIAGNTFHSGTGLPPEYASNYFFIDHVRGHLGRIVLNANNQVVSADPRWIEVGDNVLAIVGLNVTLSSSDLTLKIECEVASAIVGTPVAATDVSTFDHRAAPNPFVQRTSVAFVAEGAGAARLDVFDVRGRLLRSVLMPHLRPGPQRVVWDGRDAAGRWAPAGAYMYRLDVPGGRALRGKLTRTR